MFYKILTKEQSETGKASKLRHRTHLFSYKRDFGLLKKEINFHMYKAFKKI